jgi:Ca-activated chloride channel family protein
MVRTLVTVLVAASLVAAAAAQDQEQPQDQTVFRGGSELVRAYVTVTDRNGRLATTLRQEDFEVRDEGKPQPITLFVNQPRDIRLIVLLDVSGSMQGNLPLLRSGTAELVKHLRRGDTARIGTFGKEVVISETFTRDARELVAALPSAIDPQAPTPLWRAVDKAIETFGRTTGGAEGDARHVVLVLSDGADSGMTNFRDRFVTQGDVIDRARRQDVMVYAVGMRSRGARSVPGLGIGGLQAALSADLPDPQLARVAEETGGGYTEINFGDNLGLAFAQVAEELHSQYLLAYEPPRRDGKVHEIEIRVKQGGMKPRARKSYVAPKN